MKKEQTKKSQFKKRVSIKRGLLVLAIGVLVGSCAGCSFSQDTSSGDLFQRFVEHFTGEEKKSSKDPNTAPEATTERRAENTAPEATTEEQPFTKFETQPIELATEEPNLRYQSGQDAYILKDGKQEGTMHFNLTQRLGIWDYGNPTVVSNGIYYSYAFNLKLDFTQYFSQVESAKIEVKPELVSSKGEVIGEIANIGWSGFDQIAEIYRSEPVKNIEVCLQPTQDFSEGDYIRFNLVDTENNVTFDSVSYDTSLLKQAKDGPAVKRVKEETKIKSINGAKYSFTLNHVYSSQEYLNIDSYSDLVKMMDLDYTVKLLKDKVNDRVVTRFNTFSGVQMNSEVKLAVNTCNDTKYNYTWYKDATRAVYSDIDEYVPYVTSNFPYIKKGETANNVTNRILSYDLESKDSTYVRVIPEFTNERKARTDEEMLNFNGRYIVYQIELESRNLPKYYTGEW